MDKHEQLKASRQQVYGDPLENHVGISYQWICLLHPWADHIKAMKPLPPHVVALLLCALKLNRMRLRYHQDNYDDMEVYLQFAKDWQKTHDNIPDVTAQNPCDRPLHVFVAGPYTAGDEYEVDANVGRAEEISREILRRGHYPYCPHSMTRGWESYRNVDYEDVMRMTLAFIREKADALFFIAPSPGADRERAEAVKKGIPVYVDFATLGNRGGLPCVTV